VRNALRYVLGNGKKHAAEGRAVTVPQAIDTYTSAPWFDGFRETFVVRQPRSRGSTGDRRAHLAADDRLAAPRAALGDGSSSLTAWSPDVRC
jgi:hypothetical protein